MCFSIVQDNKHGDEDNYNPMVPALMINPSHFMVAMYNPILDCLLVTEKIPWLGELPLWNNVALLWAAIHHRRYLKQIPEPHFDGNLVCGFKSQAICQKTLPFYKCLKSYKRQDFGLPALPSIGKTRVSANVEWKASEWKTKQWNSKRHKSN